MVLNPGIIALIVGSGITLLLLISAGTLGLKILHRWDIRNNSEEQLGLERKTYLVSTLVQYGLLFEIVSAFLFIYTADDLHNLLVGAMCATGSLHANTFGFPALYAKIAVLFLAASWIAVNFIDSKAEDYPLTRKKYKLLLFIIPVASAGYYLQIRYFLSIEPNIITSCCGVLFSEGGAGAGSSLASLPVRGAKAVFFALFLLMALCCLAVIKTAGKPYTYLLSLFSGAFFFVSIAAIISFISLYFYQLPTHHCPFDMLQSGYYYSGYPLYASLFTGSFFGMITGIVEPFKNIPSLSDSIPSLQRKWATIAIAASVLFIFIAAIPMIFLPFKLNGY